MRNTKTKIYDFFLCNIITYKARNWVKKLQQDCDDEYRLHEKSCEVLQIEKISNNDITRGMGVQNYILDCIAEDS